MWESTVNDQVLKFHLAGINNQNFIMRDEETGSWWQQVSGEAIQGTLKGNRLMNVFMDEVTFGVWKREHPNGRVLRPDEKILQADKYEKASWEDEVAKMPVNITNKSLGEIEPRTIVFGIKIGSESKAYPLSALEKQSPIIDTIGGRDLIIILGSDKKSVRAFETTVDGKPLEFFAKPNTAEIELTDAETATVWNFEGAATSGKLVGKQLTKIALLKDYWFDWQTYNPNTMIYKLGNR